MGSIYFLCTYFLISAILTVVFTPWYIALLRRFKMYKKIRVNALVGQATEFAKLHKHKEWTPTAGAGIIFLVMGFLILVSLLLQKYAPFFLENPIKYSLWNRNETYLAIFTFFAMGMIGLIDDILNVREIGKTKGIPATIKIGLLTLFAAMGSWWFFYKLGYQTVALPFFGDVYLGYGYILVSIFLILSMANSVNITDGLDGLAGGLLLFNYVAYAFISYHQWLLILWAFCMIIAGGLIGFLWFNIFPAKFFMGDMGALAFGGVLAIIALMTDTLFPLLIMSGIYLVEIVSVIVQTTSKKLRNGKKIFRITPFHHHLEAIGMSETTIVMKFWIIGFFLSVAGLVIAFIK